MLSEKKIKEISRKMVSYLAFNKMPFVAYHTPNFENLDQLYNYSMEGSEDFYEDDYDDY